MASLKRSDQFRERVKIYATDLDEEALQQSPTRYR
jgi:chemotaxis methyl-accepting protein methylase